MKNFWAVASYLSIGLLLAVHSAFAFPSRPHLMLVVVVDQFRADYLTRFESKFLPALSKNGQVGGFKYLMTRGAYFQYGRYDLLQSITAPGHMTISTGSYPYQSGIVDNEWYDPQQKRMVYCTEDKDFPLLGSKETEATMGSSPKSLIGSTIGDQLKISGFPSQVVTLALKDRAAIMLAGHTADVALWFDKKSKQWTTSKYYAPNGQLPSWTKALNEGLSPELTGMDEAKLTDAISTPIGAQITADAAVKALSQAKLGRNKSTDFLGVSFSSHDASGHRYGANSKEMETMTLQDDIAISRILNAVQRNIPGGLKNVVVVLTGDHGVAPNVDWAKSIKLPYDTVSAQTLKTQLEEHLVHQLGKTDSGPWVSAVFNFRIYLNLDAIREKKLELSQVETVAKKFLTKTPGIAHVFSSADVHSKELPPGMFERQILHSYFPGRSGEIILIPKPFVTPTLADSKSATHMTGYSYDNTVPIVFSGLHIKPGNYASLAEVIDIAPTLTFLAGALPPSLSEGRVLSEILELK